MILGFDISGTTTAYTILDNSGNLIKTDKIKLSKYRGIFAKAEILKDAVEKIKIDFPKIEKIYIEEALLVFMKGFSSAKTIASLQKFNAVASWIIYRIFDILPEYLNVLSARKKAGIVYDKNDTSKLKTKKAVLKCVLALDSTFPIVYNRKGNIDITTYDMADSYVIAYAGSRGIAPVAEIVNKDEEEDAGEED